MPRIDREQAAAERAGDRRVVPRAGAVLRGQRRRSGCSSARSLALIASIKLHSPYFLTGTAELTFGRVRMAHLQAVGIGWASLATMAASVWLMCRLSRAELMYPRSSYLGGALWNIGVLLAVFGIIFGDGQSVEWLDAPHYAPPFFVAGLGIVAAWVVAVFRRRREQHVYVTQWYILAAVFWFPWIYTVAVVHDLLEPGDRRGAADRELVVRAQLPRPVVHAGRRRHGVLPDPENHRPADPQLLPEHHRLLVAGAVLLVGGDAPPHRRADSRRGSSPPASSAA